MAISTSDLRALIKSGQMLQSITKLVKTIETLEENPAGNMRRIEKYLGDMQKVTASLPSSSETRQMVESWLSRYLDRLNTRKEEIQHTFGAELESVLKAKGFELKGQYPELKAGFYTLEVDFTKGEITIWYGHKQEIMGKAPVLPSDVAKQMDRIDKELRGRPLKEDVFIKRLHEAYLRVLSKMGNKEGEHVPILEVLAEYVFLEQDKRFFTDPRKEFFKGYSRAFFSYDLYRLKQRRLLGGNYPYLRNESKYSKARYFLVGADRR